jgi:glucose-1-phosphate thymidylyltransferase
MVSSKTSTRKGIVLAGGTGSRLYPNCKATCKQLLPIYNKPLIYYSLSTLLLAGIREILIISTPKDLPRFQDLFGDGSQLGLVIKYVEQPKPEGIAQAFILGEEFIGVNSSALVLGDNLFYSHELTKSLKRADKNPGATIFGYQVNSELAHQYGIAELKDGKVINIEEKPRNPKSNIAVTGLYFYDTTVSIKAKSLKPSARGELEITALNNLYIQENDLNLELLGRGCAWLDTGNPTQLLQAGNFVQTIEDRTGLKISCVEEICFQNKWINKDQLSNIIDKLGNNEYSAYLKNLLNS